MRSDILDLTLQLHHETDKAFLVSDDGDRENAVWLPKSQVEQQENKGQGAWEFSLPEWLAFEKGLI